MNAEIIIVSGLPRSGTSLLMQMLDHGGIEVVTDRIREADTDNPRGYYEFETVKKIKQDASWLPATRGKAFKMISQLLYDLPASERYRIVFMERDFDEMLDSQEKMLSRLNRTAAPRETMKQSYRTHLERLYAWFPAQRHMQLLFLKYNELIVDPRPHAQRLSAFLDGAAEADKMVAAVDPSLYRNRSERAAPT